MIGLIIKRAIKQGSMLKHALKNIVMKIPGTILVIIITAWAFLSAAGYAMPDGSSLTIDGPYVLYRGDSIIVNYIDSASGRLSLRTRYWNLSQKDSIQLVVNTDESGKTFNVKLNPKLPTQKSVYGAPKKMLVLSDIEGNFSAMRKMLQGNGVMDEQYHWTFGNGHLVLLGDFVDRGTMVTEVLWLIYYLESQAAANGGKVHYILGNHEIMNMTGDLRYLHPRYLAHADTMKVQYLELFGPQAELGRWLSTKNIIESVGRVLFIHSGVSAYINQAELPPDAINDTARLYYFDTSSAAYPSPVSNLLFSDYGPFWYRGYYFGSPRATQEQVDSTLNLYNSRYIVTGHTLISKEIISLYEGKIINVDLPHHLGFSEALLFEGNKMYRVDNTGLKKDIKMVKDIVNPASHD